MNKLMLDTPESVIASYCITIEILRKFDDLRIKAMNEDKPVNGILDCINTIHILQYPIVSIIEECKETQKVYEKVFGEVW